jgi:hypothetical protein
MNGLFLESIHGSIASNFSILLQGGESTSVPSKTTAKQSGGIQDMSHVSENLILTMLRNKNGRVRVHSIEEFRKLLPISRCRLEAVVHGLRVCRNRGMIKLKTKGGVTQVTLRPAWR